MVIAKWNGMKFEVSSSAIKSFRDLSYSLEVQTTDKTSDKQSYIALKSRKPRTITLKLPIHQAAGVNVRAEIDNWMSKAHAAGKDYFYLGGKKLMPCKLMLTKVDASETGLSPKGDILSAVLALTFIQCAKADGSSSSSSSGKKKKTTKKVSVRKATSTTKTIKNTATPIGAVGAAVGISASTKSTESQTKKANDTIKRIAKDAAKDSAAKKTPSKKVATTNKISKVVIKK